MGFGISNVGPSKCASRWLVSLSDACRDKWVVPGVSGKQVGSRGNMSDLYSVPVANFILGNNYSD